MARDGSSALDMEELFNVEEGKKSIENPELLGVFYNDIFENKIYSPLFDFIVSDDKHPDDLIKGHLNQSVKKAIRLGIDPLNAINMVTINPAYHYGLNCGAIVEGARADYIIVDSISNLNIQKTFVGGECVFDGKNVLFEVPDIDAQNTINASKKQQVTLTFTMMAMNVKSM